MLLISYVPTDAPKIMALCEAQCVLGERTECFWDLHTCSVLKVSVKQVSLACLTASVLLEVVHWRVFYVARRSRPDAWMNDHINLILSCSMKTFYSLENGWTVTANYSPKTVFNLPLIYSVCYDWFDMFCVCTKQIQKRHSSSSMDERPSPSPSAREYVESLHQNSRATLLFGKNNVLVQPVSASFLLITHSARELRLTTVVFYSNLTAK